MKGTIIVFLLFLVIPTVYAKNNLGYINNIGNTSTLYINGQVGDISKNIPFDSDTATLIINYDSTTSSISIGNIEISGDSAKIYSQTITDKHLKIYKGRLIYGKLIGSYVGITNKIPVRISAGTINNLQVLRVANYDPGVIKRISMSIVPTFAHTTQINLGINLGSIFYMYSILRSEMLLTSETLSQNVNIYIDYNVRTGLFYLYSHPKNVDLQKFQQSVSYTYVIISKFYGNIFEVYSNPENVLLSITQQSISITNIQLNESITITN